MERRFFIIGAGMGARDGLTGEAKRALDAADAVFATARLAGLRADAKICPLGELAERAVSSGAASAALLVSGDVGFFSAAPRLRQALLPHGAVTLFCGLSSMQVFCAKLGMAYEDAFAVSLHGRRGSLLGPVSYHEKVFALTGGENRADALCAGLAEAGLGRLTVHLGENLGAADERVTTGTAASLAGAGCGDLAVLLVENPAAAGASAPIRDTMLTRGKAPMTKEEVRWVALAKLAVRPRDTVWDVGAGTGAMTLELARRAHLGLTYAVERNPEALALLRENRVKLGGYNVLPVPGPAPEALHALPAPDCVFVGGSGGALAGILRAAREKNPKVRVAVTAVSLETVGEALGALGEAGFANIETVQLAAARGQTAGSHTLMRANNPVYLFTGGGAHGE